MLALLEARRKGETPGPKALADKLGKTTDARWVKTALLRLQDSDLVTVAKIGERAGKPTYASTLTPRGVRVAESLAAIADEIER